MLPNGQNNSTVGRCHMSLDQGSQRCEHASILLVSVLVEASDTLHDQITHSDFGHPDCKKTLDQRDEARESSNYKF